MMYHLQHISVAVAEMECSFCVGVGKGSVWTGLVYVIVCMHMSCIAYILSLTCYY